MSPIQFFSEETTFKLKKKALLRNWISGVATSHNFQLQAINYIFCSDSYLLKLNEQYLQHDTYTDIITFDNSETPGVIEADIYISIDRIKENALEQQSNMEPELYRVMIHGVLHLFGFKDKTPDDKRRMREKEDACISLLKI